jgi:hypothetical protein
MIAVSRRLEKAIAAREKLGASLALTNVVGRSDQRGT